MIPNQYTAFILPISNEYINIDRQTSIYIYIVFVKRSRLILWWFKFASEFQGWTVNMNIHLYRYRNATINPRFISRLSTATHSGSTLYVIREKNSSADFPAARRPSEPRGSSGLIETASTMPRRPPGPNTAPSALTKQPQTLNYWGETPRGITSFYINAFHSWFSPEQLLYFSFRYYYTCYIYLDALVPIVSTNGKK